MTNHLPSVLVVAKQDRVRDSLQVLLTSLASIGSVAVASDFSSKLLEKESAPPTLVLLVPDSASSHSGALLTLQRIKSTWPGAMIVILVEDEGQYQDSQAAGADVTLLQGTTPAVILKQIEELLQRADS